MFSSDWISFTKGSIKSFPQEFETTQQITHNTPNNIGIQHTGTTVKFRLN
jgi:hypothetical protein